MIDRRQRLAAIEALRRQDGGMLRRFASAQVSTLSDYEIDVTVCTSTADALDGDVWVMSGVDLTRFNAHPIVLFSHDMSQPIGRASNLKVTPAAITARVTFPQAGISPKADEVRGMVKAGIITGVSAGILPTQVEPLDKWNPHAGQRVNKSILMEFSIVAVPADADSGVIGRSAGSVPRFGAPPATSMRAAALQRARAPIYAERNERRA